MEDQVLEDHRRNLAEQLTYLKRTRELVIKHTQEVELIHQEALVEAEALRHKNLERMMSEVSGGVKSIERLSATVAVAPWENEAWFNYTIGDGPEHYPSKDNSLIRVGKVNNRIPACLPNPAQHSLSIRSKKGWVPLVETLLVKMLATTPGVRVHILDPEGNGSSLARFGKADTSRGGVFEPTKVLSADITDTLNKLGERVAHVSQNFLQGVVGDLHEYNRQSGTPEDLHVLVALNCETYNNEQVSALEKLVRVGGKAGVNVIKVIGDIENGRKLSTEAERCYRGAAADAQELYGKWVLQVGNAQVKVQLDPEPNADVVHAVTRWAEQQKRKGVKPLSLAEQLKGEWAEPGPSIKAVIGKSGTGDFELELGIRGAHPHLLIAGRTGAGKSTLLHSIICAYASSYSPQDLQFYLVDAKQGVEMKHYTPGAKNLPGGRWLPHLAIGAVKTDMRAYMSVLEKVRKDIKERGKLCSDNGVSDVYELASKEPSLKVPRIIVVLDEFHVLLTDQQYGTAAAALLKDVAKQARAYGIHLILATQSLGNLGARGENAALFEQIGNRIALSCDVNVSEMVLGNGNTAASGLTRQGEAIFTSVVGSKEHNTPVQVGFINPENERAELITRLHEKAGEVKTPFVFSGEGLTPLAGSPLWEQSAGSERIWLGAPVKIANHLSVKLDRYQGGHMLFYGTPSDDGEDLAGAMQAVALSMALAREDVKFLVVEPDEDREISVYMPTLVRNLQSCGRPVTEVQAGRRAEDRLKELEENLETHEGTTVVLIPDGDISVGAKGLVKLLEKGAQNGVHIVCSFANRRTLNSACGTTILDKALALFDTRIFMNLASADASANVLGLPEKPANEEERFTLWEARKPNNTEVFIPYQMNVGKELQR